MRTRLAVLGVAAVLAVLAVQVTPASAGPATGEPTATASGKLVRVLGPNRFRVARKLRYRIWCSADCRFVVRTKLFLAGPDLGPLVLRGTALAGTRRVIVLRLNRGARRAILRNLRAARLRVRVKATNRDTGGVERVTRVFRFKR